MKSIPNEALQNIVERPKYLDKVPRSEKGLKLNKIAETLRLIDRTKALSYDVNEFKKEFGNNAIKCVYQSLKNRGLKKVRVVVDKDIVYVWCND